MTPADLARAYGVGGVIDYGRHRRPGLLVATGAGLMMAAMDLPDAPWRWCADIGGGRAGDPAVVEWIVASSWTVESVGLAAWFTITSPERLRAALPGVRNLVVYSQPSLGDAREVGSLDDLAGAFAQATM